MSRKEKLTLIIPAGKASSGPPIGPMIGQRGINLVQFCSKFNDITQDFVEGIPINTKISVTEGRSFQMNARGPALTYYIFRLFGTKAKQIRQMPRGSMKLNIKILFCIGVALGFQAPGEIKSIMQTLKGLNLEFTKTPVGDVTQR